MKIFIVVVCSADDWWIDGVFHTHGLADTYIRDRQLADYAKYCHVVERNTRLAARWVAAGGGLSEPVEDIPTFGAWLIDHAWEYGRVEEHIVRPVE